MEPSEEANPTAKDSSLLKDASQHDACVSSEYTPNQTLTNVNVPTDDMQEDDRKVDTAADHHYNSGQEASSCTDKPTSTKTPESTLPQASVSADHEESSQSNCDNKSKSTSPVDFDPYAYLQRQEFTTEIYKIEINNLPKRLGYSQVKKKLFALNLKPSKVKLIDPGDFAYVNFRSEEDRQQALKVLNNFSWKGREIKAKNANPAADPFLKRKQDAAKCPKDSKRSRPNDEDDATPIVERLNNAVTPLWKSAYEDQLKKKHSEMVQYMKKLARQIERNNRGERWKFSRTVDLLQDISPSPVINGYRNKCEFTVGPGFDGDNVVGFRLGSYVSGEVRVVEPTECVHVSPRTKLIVQIAQCYLQKHSKHGAFNPASKDGNWMQVTVRENRDDQAMAVFHFNQQNLDQEVVVAEKQKLKEYFVEGEGKAANITSLFFQLRTDRLAETQTPPELLHGDEYIIQTLFNMKFRISPNAFFQVNTAAAEVLYRTVGDFCKLDKEKTVLLDICCGTGTIGLTLAKQVKRIVGIEICEEAVEDGKVNMKLNDIENAEFECGKAEDVLPRILRREVWNSAGGELTAVVDPPRAGLHSDVIRAIRKNDTIKQLVYVSCHPKSALQNLLDLTRSESNRVKGVPFFLLKIKPLDLFPHTDHCELVLLLER